MKFLKSSKKNKGFSLVEVIVTMAVITIISIPIIRTFLVTANVNRNAKKLQNATDIAQNIEEYFTTRDLERIIAQYSEPGADSICGEFVNEEDITVFRNIGDGSVDESGVPYYKGIDDEKFYVTVAVDKSTYEQDEDADGVSGINSKTAPSLQNLYGNNIVTCFKELLKYDTSAKSHFEDEGFTNINEITKETLVKLSVVQKADEYEYTYSYKAVYKLNGKEWSGSPDYTLLKHGVVNKSAATLPGLCVIYQSFDSDTTREKCSDIVRVQYDFENTSGADDAEKPLGAYVISQTGGKEIKTANIFVEHNGSTDGFTEYINNKNGLSVSSNVNESLTAGDKSIVTLYAVSVYIKYDECFNKSEGSSEKEYVNHIMTLEDIYTSVSSTREE